MSEMNKEGECLPFLPPLYSLVILLSPMVDNNINIIIKNIRGKPVPISQYEIAQRWKEKVQIQPIFFVSILKKRKKKGEKKISSRNEHSAGNFIAKTFYITV